MKCSEVKFFVMLVNCCTFMGCSLPSGAQHGYILRLSARGEGLYVQHWCALDDCPLEMRAIWCLAAQCSMTEEGVLFRLCISSNLEMLATLYMHACLEII